MKFSTRLGGLFIGLFLLSFGIAGYVGYTSASNMLEVKAKEKLEVQVFHSMDKIDRMLFERYKDMQFLAADPVIGSATSTPEQISGRLKEFLNMKQFYLSLAFFDLKRTRIADTSGTNIGKQHPFTEYWPDIAGGKDFVLLITMSDTFKEAVLYSASVVKDKKGKKIGVVVSRIPVESLYKIIRQAAGIRQTEKELMIELLDKNGLILYSDYNKNGILKALSDDWGAIKGFVSKGEKVGSARHYHKGEDEISAFAQEQGYLDFRGNDWILVICTPSKKAFAGILEQRNKFIIIFSVIGFIVFFSTIIFSRAVTKPLKELGMAAVAIGKGDFDINVKVESEDEIGQLARAFNDMALNLRESEKKYKDLAELLPQFVFETDDKGNILFFNHHALENLGYTQDDFKKGLNAFQMFIPEEMDRVRENIQRILSGEVLDGLEFTVIRKDGTAFPVLLFASPIVHENNIAGIRGIAIDITELKRAAEEVRKLNEGLELKVAERTKQLLDSQEELVRKEKLAILGRLAGSVGHELRNPLGVMSNAVYYLKSVMSGADESVKEYLDIIKGEIDNSQRIITDLLDFTRTKTPQANMVAVDELIKQSLGKSAVPANVTLRVEIPDTLPSVKVDPLQLGQVFQNLVTNAIQAMPDGGELRIAARRVSSSEFQVLSSNLKPETSNLKPDADFVKISVADTGEGIKPENMAKLFQPLFTTKARGIGLGLTVVKNLTEANGGRLEVDSQIGRGTTITVILPCERG